MKNIVETVNIKGELEANGDKWKMEKIRSDPCTVTIPWKKRKRKIPTTGRTLFLEENHGH